MIPVALSTGSVYTYGTARAFELAARVGFDGVELLVDERWDTRQSGYVRRLIDQFRAPVLSVHSPFVWHVPGWPQAEIERIRQSVSLAEALDARTVNLHVPLRFRDARLFLPGRSLYLPLPGPGADHRAFAAWLVNGGLAAEQANTPVTLAVENLPLKRLFGRRYSRYALNTWDELLTFPHLCLDTTHCGTTGSDLLEVYERLAPNVVHVHLSDYDGRYEHKPVERGVLPLDAFLKALAARRFPGLVVVELTPGGLPMQDEAKLEAELRRNLEFCRRHLADAGGTPAVAPPNAVGATAREPNVV